MKIFVKTFYGEVHTLEVEPTDTIMSVKAEMSRFHNIPIDLLVLALNPPDFLQDRNLSDYGIQEGTTLYSSYLKQDGQVAEFVMKEGAISGSAELTQLQVLTAESE